MARGKKHTPEQVVNLLRQIVAMAVDGVTMRLLSNHADVLAKLGQI